MSKDIVVVRLYLVYIGVRLAEKFVPACSAIKMASFYGFPSILTTVNTFEIANNEKHARNISCHLTSPHSFVAFDWASISLVLW